MIRSETRWMTERRRAGAAGDSTMFILVGETCGGCGRPWAECECQPNATVTHGSTSVTVGMPVVPDGQDWFWVKEWQSTECQADADLAAGRFVTYDTMDEFLDSLDKF